MPRFTLPLHTSEATLASTGGKGNALSRLCCAGFNVPLGFVVTTAAYQRFVAHNQLASTISAAALPDAVNGMLSFAAGASEIRSRFMAATVPADVVDAIVASCTALGPASVAVRSSATAEDLPELSFAGQQDTLLNVKGVDAILAAVLDCWASLWNPRAMAYRHEANLHDEHLAMAVVIQHMMPASVAGVLFTANPVSGARDEMLINASYGLGEAIVSGETTPDTFVVDRRTLAIRQATTGAKQKMTVSGQDSGIALVDVPDEQRTRLCLDQTQVRDLTDLALQVEEEFQDLPLDIEWLISDGQLWLLQARPITRLPPPPLDDVRWDAPAANALLLRRQLVEHIPDPVAPLFDDVYLQDALQRAWSKVNHRPLGDRLIHPTVNGYAYKRVGGPDAEHTSQWWLKRTPANANAAHRKPWYRRLQRWMASKRAEFERYTNAPRRWQQRVLPAHESAIANAQKLDIDLASHQELIEGILGLARADADYWFSGTAGLLVLTRLTEARLHGLLDNSGLSSGSFLTGLPSRATDAQQRLTTIAANVRRDDRLIRLVTVTPPQDLVAALARESWGVDIHAMLQDYLRDFGHLGHSLDFSVPPAVHDPLPVLLGLRSQVIGNTAPLAVPTRLAVERHRAHWRAMRFFHFRYPAFLWRWWVARRLYPYREEALSHVGEGWPLLRNMALELGARLHRDGALAQADDVFYLHLDELNLALGADAPPAGYRELVEDRRQLQAAQRQLSPPFQIPEPRPAERERTMNMWGIDIKGGSGAYNQVDNADSDHVLQGFACSPGVITAPASVIRTPADFASMQAGTILVCPTTTPVWTELFTLAAGLVTDTGGILAHGSIVAREYGIPAVLGTGNITARITSGTIITVDGNRGLVSIGEQSTG